MHDYDQLDDEEDFGPSRSEQRREALGVFELALQLVEQSDARIGQFPMDDGIKALVIASKKITAQIARKRQVQYLAKMLRREEDATLAAIRAALDHDKVQGRREAAALHQVEYWRDRLVAQGDEALDELLQAHPGANRQQLRQLARNAQREKLAGKPPHASRELFRELRELLAQTPSDDADGSASAANET